MTTAIQANNLTKQYPIDSNWKQLIEPARLSFPAVDKVSLEVKNGEIFGLIGPNGAGKTTLMNVLLGIYSPTNGKISEGDMNMQMMSTEFWRGN